MKQSQLREKKNDKQNWGDKKISDSKEVKKLNVIMLRKPEYSIEMQRMTGKKILKSLVKEYEQGEFGKWQIKKRKRKREYYNRMPLPLKK